VVELRVVEAVEQVDGARARRGHADAGAPGELGVPDGLQRRHLLVAGLDEPGLIVGLPEGHDQPVDPVAGVAEHLLDAPLAQPRQYVVADGLAHASSQDRRSVAFPRRSR
jgi:hypothetical protein